MKIAIITNKEYSSESDQGEYIYECSKCHNTRLMGDYSYCPDCGAKLDWKTEEEPVTIMYKDHAISVEFEKERGHESKGKWLVLLDYSYTWLEDFYFDTMEEAFKAGKKKVRQCIKDFEESWEW